MNNNYYKSNLGKSGTVQEPSSRLEKLLKHKRGKIVWDEFNHGYRDRYGFLSESRIEALADYFTYIYKEPSTAADILAAIKFISEKQAEAKANAQLKKAEKKNRRGK